MLDGLKLAFGTLTCIPVAPPGRVDRLVAARAMALAPLTQLPLIAILLIWGLAVRALPVPGLVASAATLVGVTLATRAMHLDGLADTADGLSASYDRQTSLDVMHRGNIGPSGVAAIVLVLLVDVTALASLMTSWRGVILVCVSLLASRHLLAWACAAGVPSARAKGLGATVAGTVRRSVVALGFLLLLGVSTVATIMAGAPWWAGLIVLASAAATGVLMIHRAGRRFGGITGDVLGAVIELSFAAALTASALVVTVS